MHFWRILEFIFLGHFDYKTGEILICFAKMYAANRSNAILSSLSLSLSFSLSLPLSLSLFLSLSLYFSLSISLSLSLSLALP